MNLSAGLRSVCVRRSKCLSHAPAVAVNAVRSVCYVRFGAVTGRRSAAVDKVARILHVRVPVKLDCGGGQR